MNIPVSSRLRLPRTLMVGLLLTSTAWTIGTLLGSNDVETARAAVILSVLVVVSLFLFWLLAQSDPEGRTLLVLLFASFALKLAASYFRFHIGLLADALEYNASGRDIATQLSAGQWPEQFGPTGTFTLRLLTGLVYLVTGPTFYGITILWSWLALLGMFFFYKAFTTAFPEGNRRLYMFLTFLYPSILLWTGSLSKDALMFLLLGMAAYGAARLQRRIELIGLGWLALGIGGALMIRPHIAGIFAVGVGASTLFRPIRAGLLTPILRLAGVIVIAVLAMFVLRTGAQSVGLAALSEEETFGFLEARRSGTFEGGSAFQQTDPRTPAGFAMLIPTILFRPFPWEAHSTFAAVATIEGMILLALVLYRRRSIVRAIAMSRRNSYLSLVLVYALLFIVIFSGISNFGILVRQRVQLLPFLFMLIAYLAPPSHLGRTGKAPA